MSKGLDFDELTKSNVKTIPRAKLKKPKLYRVILFNDDYTSMDFVVEILMTIFNKPAAEATKIMLDVHKKGTGVCGVYTFDIAVTKVNQVHQEANLHEYPLRCGYEEI
ncbi:MAG: ATP-dependent Clp protease adapter ClpS [Acidobacteria bacterium]|jgi:ATP-dependent Clp protease adaptor protein ClpS|nr:ATP-dependent Clp protease adapter ClpS [Acidobacteriota bacterium]